MEQVIENEIETRMDDEFRQDWLRKMASVSEATATIDSTLFDKYEVKRGIYITKQDSDTI